jgi:hypothetical protein
VQLSVQDCGGYGSVTVTYNQGSASQVLSIYPGPGDTGLANWTPNGMGVANFKLGNAIYSTTTVVATPTTTTISAPNTAKIGTATQITATVQSTSPSQWNPPGQVVFKDSNGATLSTNGLTPGPGTGQSYAYYWWTPQSPGDYIVQATYVPSNSSATPSTSSQDLIEATASGGNISISAPPTMTLGQSVTMSATVVPKTVQGTVGFTANGNPISAAIPIVNGVATFTWTPNIAGQVTLGASYTTNAGGSGSTSEVVTIANAPAQQDAITLIQPGWGPWAPNGTYTLGNGSNFAFQASSLSRAPVTLSETGPCQVSGLTINVPTGSGVCNLQASTNGGNGYAPVTTGYAINLIPGIQTADVSAPPSGRYKVGRVLVLESPGQMDTNAGQNIRWKIKKKGRSNCKLLYPDNGSVTLRIQKKGECTVIGSAPGVAGQWQPFKTARKYRGR